MRRTRSRLLISSLALALGAGTATAQDRAALVIANTGYDGAAALPDLRRATENMSETLFGLGFTVSRLENATQADILAGLEALDDHDGPVVIYYAGHGFAHEGLSYLLPVGAAQDAALSELAAVSVPADEVLDEGWVTILDICHGVASQGLPGAGALDQTFTAAIVEDDETLVLASVPPGQACPVDQPAQLTDVMLERLALPGLLDSQLLPEPATEVVVSEDGTEEEVQITGFYTASTRAGPFVFRQPVSGARLSQEDYELLENVSPSARTQLLALWQEAGIIVDFEGETASAPTSVGQVTNETVVLTAPVRPVATASTVAPVSVASAAGVSRVTNDVQILTVAPTVVSAPARPVPGAGGLPLPSIIVGFPEEEVIQASFETVDSEAPTVGEVDVSAVGGSEISYENVSLRRDFAENNRDLYLSLVDSGAFDPPQALMARALQTELARMNCYTAGIDGIWGNGSRRSVGRYYEQIEGSAPSQDPVLEIWRQLMLKDDVRCPDVVVAQPRRTTTTQSAPRRTTTQAAPRRAAPAPAPRRAAPAPAPQPSAPARRTISSSSGTGVFR